MLRASCFKACMVTKVRDSSLPVCSFQRNWTDDCYMGLIMSFPRPRLGDVAGVAVHAVRLGGASLRGLDQFRGSSVKPRIRCKFEAPDLLRLTVENGKVVTLEPVNLLAGFVGDDVEQNVPSRRLNGRGSVVGCRGLGEGSSDQNQEGE